MNIIKRFFPISAKLPTVKSLIIAIIIYVVAGAVVGTVMGLLAKLSPAIVDWLFRVVAWLADVYCSAGVVLSVLVFAKVIR